MRDTSGSDKCRDPEGKMKRERLRLLVIPAVAKSATILASASAVFLADRCDDRQRQFYGQEHTTWHTRQKSWHHDGCEFSSCKLHAHCHSLKQQCILRFRSIISRVAMRLLSVVRKKLSPSPDLGPSKVIKDEPRKHTPTTLTDGHNIGACTSCCRQPLAFHTSLHKRSKQCCSRTDYIVVA